jgi:hypothetical protein
MNKKELNFCNGEEEAFFLKGGKGAPHPWNRWSFMTTYSRGKTCG